MSDPGLSLRCVQWHVRLDSDVTPQVLVYFHLFNQPSITAGSSQQQNTYSENYINRIEECLDVIGITAFLSPRNINV